MKSPTDVLEDLSPNTPNISDMTVTSKPRHRMPMTTGSRSIQRPMNPQRVRELYVAQWIKRETKKPTNHTNSISIDELEDLSPVMSRLSGTSKRVNSSPAIRVKEEQGDSEDDAIQVVAPKSKSQPEIIDLTNSPPPKRPPLISRPRLLVRETTIEQRREFIFEFMRKIDLTTHKVTIAPMARNLHEMFQYRVLYGLMEEEQAFPPNLIDSARKERDELEKTAVIEPLVEPLSPRLIRARAKELAAKKAKSKVLSDKNADDQDTNDAHHRDIHRHRRTTAPGIIFPDGDDDDSDEEYVVKTTKRKDSDSEEYDEEEEEDDEIVYV